MPSYTFKHKKTGEVVERFISISAMVQFLSENPDYEHVINGAPMVCDPVRVGARKFDTGFKEVLQRVHEKTPGSQLDKSSSQL